MPFRLTATMAIAVITVVVSLVLLATGSEGIASILGGFIPLRVGGVPLPEGWIFVPWWLTPLSATLIHAGAMHLIFNMVMLLVAGRETETALGPRWTVGIYVAGAYAAALGQYLTFPLLGDDPQSRMIGASGAVSALIGCMAMLFGRGRAKAIGPIPAMVVQGVWLIAAWSLVNYALAWAAGQMGYPLAWAAHVGGFALGVAVARPILTRRFQARPRPRVVH